MFKQSHDHYDHSDQKHEQGYSVHTVHEPDVHISWFIGVALAEIEICQYLLPHSKKGL